jgi:hypothetical protein
MATVVEPGSKDPFICKKDGKRCRKSVQESRTRTNSLLGFDKCAHRATCQDDTTNMMSVRMHVEKIKIVCIHPQNDSFPVFTKKFDQLKITYNSFQDHDSFEGQMGNFRVLDNTNYPRTLDPFKNYSNSDKIPYHQILGFKIDKNLKPKPSKSQTLQDKDPQTSSHVIKFSMTLFHYPLDLACPIQQSSNNSQYDKLVKLEMKQLQINHMHELMFRLNDYFFYQFIYAITDANPYFDIIERPQIESDPVAEGGEKGAGGKGETKDEEGECSVPEMGESEDEEQSSSQGSSESS